MSCQRPSLPRTPGLALALLTGLGFALPGQAADDTSIEEVVVTASGFAQKPADAPASISIVSRADLQARPYTSLADALRDVEGIDVGSGQDKNGNISITMRGLPADYTLILIDGRRQSDIGDIGPNNFGNSQFMYMPPLEAIERIEIVRGPMSTLYGADAIGGVMNIITRKVVDAWHGNVTASTTHQQDKQFGNDRKTDLNLTGPLIPGKLGIGLRASIYDREPSEPGYSDNLLLPDGTVWEDAGSFGDRKIVAARNWNTGVVLNYTPHANHDLKAEFDIARQRYDNSDGQTGTLDGAESLWRASAANIIQPRVGYTEFQRVQREQLVLAHTGRWNIGTTESSLTLSTSENLGRSLPLTVQERTELQEVWNQALIDQGVARNPQLTDALAAQLESQFLPRPLRALELRNTIFDSKLETSIGKHAVVAGVQFLNAEMEDGVFGMYGDGFRDGTTQDHRQWALFTEANLELGSAFTLTTGVRVDDHNIFGMQTSPRAYLVYSPASAWTIKGGVSTGYKTPKPNQLFPGITGFGGQGVSPFVGTPGLQPETSVNYEVGTYFEGDGRLSANLTVFANDFRDKIINQDNLPNCEVAPSGNACVDIGPGWAALGFTSFRQAANVDEATTRGIELAGNLAITDTLELRANYTYTDSEIKSGVEAGSPLVNTPRDMINATLNWQVLDNVALSLASEVRSERYRGMVEVAGPQGPETVEQYYKAYDLLHLGVRYEVNDRLAFNGRINNLLDEDLSSRSCLLAATEDSYSCTPDYNVTEKARNFWLSLNYSF